jgi:hypothetical protein
MRIVYAAALIGAVLFAQGRALAAVDNDTYHGDNLRTGWNSLETTLNTTNVATKQFHKLFSVKLDGTSYTQPLIAAAETIPGQGVHDLLIAGTNKDFLYAFDANSGSLIWKRSFVAKKQGVTDIPISHTGCPNTGEQDGILSTPVIDRTADLVYVVVGTLETAGGTHIHFRLHALGLATGLDALTPVDIAGTYYFSGGEIVFNPDVQFQRPALLEANGNVYVGFGSQCDYNGNLYHGWVFAYATNGLTPAGLINVTPVKDSSGNYFGGIWMSGEGLSADEFGNIYFSVGNGTFDGGLLSFGESVLRLPPNLTLIGSSFFTPYTVFNDNSNDADTGSGGVMLLPDQVGSIPHQLVAQGKDGILTLLNRDSLGGFVSGGPDNALAELALGGVWSAPAYWQDPSGNANVFTTGGSLYRVLVGPSSLTVTSSTGINFPSSDGNGSTPTISSNGSAAGSAIAWIVRRPVNVGTDQLALYAFDASNLQRQLFAASIGYWNESGSNATLVPTVANGKVYVANAKAILAFGLRGGHADTDVSDEGETRAAPTHVVYGIVKALHGSQLIVQTRTGKLLSVDIAPARRLGRTGVLYPNRPVALRGEYDARRVYHVEAISSAYGLRFGAATWPEDR